MNESISVTKQPAVTLRLRITAAAEAQVRGGHPWVFAESVREQNRNGTAGELAVIFDRNDRFLAVGLFDPNSPIRVRVLHAGRPKAIDTQFWRARLEEAARRREGICDGRTTGYRLINGESDGWPGLVLDRYEATLVLKIYTAAWLPGLEGIVRLIWCGLNPERVVLRMSRNVQAIITSSPILPHASRSSSKGEQLSAARPKVWRDGEVLFLKRSDTANDALASFIENGLRFEADVFQGQKTGFFLDQRENRHFVEMLAQGRAVLNTFSFSGGFSLYAARGGAESVTDLDISAHALESAKRNFALNKDDKNVKHCQHETIRADAFKWLAGHSQPRFDLIVLDPPSLAKREAQRASAIRIYGTLAKHGIKCLNRNGVLIACSCSAHVSAEEFFSVVRQSAIKSGRSFRELHTTRHAADHPATFKEAEYLKAIYLRFDDLQ